MNPITQTILLTASAIRMVPHIALYLICNKELNKDLRQVQDQRPTLFNFIKAMTREHTFRNLFYYRMGPYLSAPISWLCPPERTLRIWCPSIGPGAHFEHNYATYLNAESIGSHFYCLQLVTLGTGHHATGSATPESSGLPDRPTVGNHVRILTGAIVFGNIHIGDHSIIGAGAVVGKDVPPNCTVAGNPARIVRQNGKRVNLPL